MRHVVVTGGSRGIGAATARAFLGAGDRVTALSRSGDAPEGAKGIAVDLIDADATAQVIAELGDVDVLVLCAGSARQMALDELQLAHFHEAMDRKYFSYVNILYPVAQQMAARGQGVILPVIGMGGKKATTPHISGGAANAALMLVTTGLGAALAGQGVRIVGVNPGPVATGRFLDIVAAHAAQHRITADEARAALSSNAPSGRVPDPEEIADMLLLLASDGARAVNGTVIALDGGATPVI